MQYNSSELPGTPWAAAPVIEGRQHPGEIRGQAGPIAYASLNLTQTERDTALKAMAATPEMTQAIAQTLNTHRTLNGPDGKTVTVITEDALTMLQNALAKANGNP